MALEYDTNVLDGIDEDAPIHDHMPVLTGLLDANQYVALKEAIYDMLENPVVRFWQRRKPNRKEKLSGVVSTKGGIDFDKFDRVGSVNNYNEAYSTMEQSDLMSICAEAFQETGDPFYKRLALAAGDVLLDPYDDGGLRAQQWLVAQTSRTQKDMGRTLNKALVGIRNLHIVGKDLGVHRYVEAAVKAINFMVKSEGITKKNKVPNIYDYVPRNDDGTPIARSWLYYGIGGAGRPYYLSENLWKNGNYHIFCMRLLYAIKQSMGSRFPLAEFQSTSQLKGTSILKYMGDAVTLKGADGWQWNGSTPPAPAKFYGLDTEKTPIPNSTIRGLFT